MPTTVPQSTSLKKRQVRLTVLLLAAWAIASFGLPFWARNLSFNLWGRPFHFWMAAQGALLVFLLIVAIYAWLMNRWEAQEAAHLQAATQVDPQV